MSAQVNLTLSAPRSQGGTVVAASSITLKPGFSFAASSGNNLSLKIDANASTPYASGTPALSQGQNYILTRTYKTDDGAGYMEKIQYFDGLGRPSQTVQAGASPSGADLVTYQEYDGFGRESNAWLPRPAGGNNGAFVPLASFTALLADGYHGDAAPYSNPVYEPSPLNRIQQQFGPGQDWRTNGKSVKTEYLANTASGVLSCALYEVTSDGLLKRNGSYPAGQLYVTKTTSEDGNASYEFKDKFGQVILTRQGIGTSYSTYYVYDDSGKIRFVLPPSASILLASNNTWNLDNQTLKDFAYIYKYDSHNRCIQKRIPGCDWAYFVYDKADRLIMTQDGEQCKSHRWSVNSYDQLGRLIYTSEITDTGSRSADSWNSAFASSVLTENISTAGFGYTQSNFAAYPCKMLSVNYYDDYNFLSLSPSALTYTSEAGYDTRYDNAKGLVTGGRQYQLDDSTKYTVTATYYDYRGRVVQTKSSNHLGGTESEYIAYDFTGHPTRKKHVHTSPQAGTVTELYTYTYDHAGRPTETRHSLNGGAQQLLAKLSYDELGRLQNHKAGSSTVVNTGYAYNVRSWTSSMDDPKFKETLVYGYDGNISRQSTLNNGVTVNYDFTYDELSRLTHAVSSGTFGTSRSIYYRYDEQGNIIDFLRDVNGNQADVSIQYNGNQLKKATDYSNAASSSNPLSAGFADYANLATEYAYNANGAMTKDLNKGISNISYNLLNLPQQVDILSPIAEARNNYSYSASGEKLRVVQRYNPHYSTSPVIGSAVNTSALGVTKTTDYVGNKVFENNALKRILVDGGYIENGTYYFYIPDHLGNNRVVVNQAGSGLQNTDYYPFGKPMQHSVSAGAQPYKFGGKEYDTMHGVDWYDFEARMLGTDIPVFSTADPLSEKYYSWSPYAYCAGNPLNRVEVGGRLFLFVSGFDINTYMTSGYRVVGQDDNGTYAKDVPVDRSLHRNDDIKYWEDVDRAYKEAYKDYNSYFINASYTPMSTAQLRYKEGEEAGQNIVAKLASGEIKMGEGETIKIVGHSQGAAYAAGMAYVIANSKYKSLLEFVDYLSPHQPTHFSNPEGVKGRQFSTRSDKVASEGFLPWMTGSSFGKIQNTEWGGNRDKYKGGLGGHAVNTWLNYLINYWRALGIPVTVN